MLRIVNWIKWFLAAQPDQVLPSRPGSHSLAVQTRWLRSRLEWHLLGNHLFANAKALVFAGLYFDGAEAQAWLVRGCAILARELPEQILADGGQFERSPMYHALALEDLLDLLNLIGARRRRIRRLRATLWRPRLREADLAHAALAALHDAPRRSCWRCSTTRADGIAPGVAGLERYAAALAVIGAAATAQA